MYILHTMLLSSKNLKKYIYRDFVSIPDPIPNVRDPEHSVLDIFGYGIGRKKKSQFLSGRGSGKKVTGRVPTWFHPYARIPWSLRRKAKRTVYRSKVHLVKNLKFNKMHLNNKFFKTLDKKKHDKLNV